MNGTVSCVVKVDKNFRSTAFSILRKGLKRFCVQNISHLINSFHGFIQLSHLPLTFTAFEKKTLFPENMRTMLGG